MKFVPDAVTRAVGRQMLVAQKNSPTILFGAGVVGVVTSTVLACRATLKLDEVLEETEQKMKEVKTLEHVNYSEQDRKQDLVVLRVKAAGEITKLYAPAIIIGTLSIAALAGSHNILSKRNAALATAYAAIERSFSDYRARVVDEYGEDKERELRYGTAVSTIQETTESGTKKTKVKHVGPRGEGSIYEKFFSQTNPNWSPVPEYNLLFLKGQQNWVNDRLRAKGYIFLNDVYDSLGIERTSAGQIVGWVRGYGDDYVDFGIWEGKDMVRMHEFLTGPDKEILLDFNVDGPVYHLLDELKKNR